MITAGWRAGWFLATESDNYLTILPVLDSLPGVLLTFILGFSLNFLPDQLSVTQRRRGIAISLCALLTLMQWQLMLDDVYWTGHWILIVWPPLTAIPIAGLVYFLREPSPEWQWLQQRWLVWLGHVSFGIYLWHFQVMRVLVLLYPNLWDTPATSLLALLISASGHSGLGCAELLRDRKTVNGLGKKYA